MKNSEYLEVAKKAAVEAGNIVLDYYNKITVIEDRGGSDVVTKTDLESEAKIIEIIRQSFPSHNLISEEIGIENKGSDYTWIIDPLDGTVSFITGIPHFAVSIGLLRDNQPIVGVVNRVAADELYWAEVGQGAFLNGAKIQVNREFQLSRAAIGSDFGYRNRGEDLLKWHAPLVDRVRYLYNLGGATYSSVLVAKGILSAYVHRARYFDYTASAVLVTEAGGKVTDFRGNALDWSKEWLEAIFSNGLIHDQIVEALKG